MTGEPKISVFQTKPDRFVVWDHVNNLEIDNFSDEHEAIYLAQHLIKHGKRGKCIWDDLEGYHP